jgi:hypothetical protein
MSSLLERHAGIKDLMDRGELVPDTMARAQSPTFFLGYKRGLHYLERHEHT